MAQTQPNILLITTDQHRYDAIAGLGPACLQTPNLTELACRGVRFDAAYTPYPVCIPARASLLTGQYNHTHSGSGGRVRHLQEGTWTCARALRDAGYRTAAIGKMHFNPMYADHGFNTMLLAEHDPMQKGCFTQDDYHRSLLEMDLRDMQEEWQYPSCFPNASQEYRENLQAVPFDLPEHLHSTSWIGEQSIEFLKNNTEPFFLWTSFLRPHHPFNPPARYMEMYMNEDLELPDPRSGWETLPEALHPYFAVRNAHGAYDFSSLNRELLQRIASCYYGSITHIDDWIGRILAHIDPASTLVVFTADHGEWLGRRGRLLKDPCVPVDDLARVPFIMSWPGHMAHGETVRTPVSLVDFAPTILQVAGLPVPDHVEGVSLLPLCGGAPQQSIDHSRPVYCEVGWTVGSVMVRQDKWKYIWHLPQQVAHLYDMQTDPLEKVNLSGTADVRAIEAQLHRLVEQWLSEQNVERVG